jgi:hypothetical protein
LILSCSRSKRPGSDPLPAVERYDGPAFRVLRRYLREADTSPPAVRIISAEFGLLAPQDRVGLYDRRMTPQRAEELEPAVRAAFQPFVQTIRFDDLMVVASDIYVAAMTNCWPMLEASVTVHVPSGSIGRRVSQLRDWLYGEPPEQAPVAVLGRVTFKGTEIVLSDEQVLDEARKGLADDGLKAAKFESWCVPVGERVVAPKWLVSRLSGVPVSAFRTAEALTVLRKLGVEVKRVVARRHERNVGKRSK